MNPSGKRGDNLTNLNNNNNSGVLPVNNYDCTKDIYNCANFTTQSEAQVAFDSCFGSSGDVWQLDKDGDGRVCETLA